MRSSRRAEQEFSVKGTEFQLLVSKGYMIVALESGALSVTTNKGRVVSVDQPGTSVTVHKDGRVEGPTPFSGTITRYANAQFPYFGNAPPPAINVLTTFSFTGCYVGAQTGVSQAFTRFDNTYLDPTEITDARSSDPHYRPSIGGISGCSYQFGPIVVGGEVEYGYDGHSSSGVSYSGGPLALHGSPLPEHVLGQSFNTTGLGRARSSAGYTVLPNLLVYVAGGWTFAGTNTALNGVVAAASPVDVSASNNKMVNGGNAGFGAEYAFAPGLIARVEYIYDRFTPSYSYDFPAVSAVSRSSAKYNENTMRAALLFKSLNARILSLYRLVGCGARGRNLARVATQGASVLATRNPRSLLCSSVGYSPLKAERRNCGFASQEPPRTICSLQSPPVHSEASPRA